MTFRVGCQPPDGVWATAAAFAEGIADRNVGTLAKIVTEAAAAADSAADGGNLAGIAEAASDLHAALA